MGNTKVMLSHKYSEKETLNNGVIINILNIIIKT